MSQTLEQIRQYWNSRAEGYTLSNREELEDEHRIFLWEQQIRRALNDESAGMCWMWDVVRGSSLFCLPDWDMKSLL